MKVGSLVYDDHYGNGIVINSWDDFKGQIARVYFRTGEVIGEYGTKVLTVVK